MPKLNDNEKRLLMILGIGVFIVANVLGYFLFSDVMANTKRQEVELRERQANLEKARDNADTAEQLQQYLLEHLKEPPSEEHRENYLDGVISRLSSEFTDLELSKNATMSTVSGRYFIRSRYKTNVKGPWPQVKEFIYRLQSPEAFCLVTSLSMVPKKSEEDDSIQLVEATLQIEKFWPLTGEAVAADVEGLSNNEQPAAETVQPDDDSVAGTPAPAPGDAPAPAPADSSAPPAPAPPPSDPASPEPPSGVSVPNPPPDNSPKPTL